MHIDQAIELLQKEKAGGTQHLIFAYWTADIFGRKDDDAWAYDADIGDEIDWSSTHERLGCAMSEFREDLEDEE